MEILLVGMVALSTRSVSDTQYSRDRALASHYMEEGLEEARKWRDSAEDWDAFKAHDNVLDEEVGTYKSMGRGRGSRDGRGRGMGPGRRLGPQDGTGPRYEKGTCSNYKKKDRR